MFRYSFCDRETDRYGCDRYLLSKGSCGSLHTGYTGQGSAGDPAWLYPWLSVLSGRYAVPAFKNTGHEEISLSSLSSSDYSDLAGIVNFLIDHCEGQGINISLPSLRIDAFSLDVMSKVQDIKKSSLTFAPEAGSQRMRDVINKGLTEEDILKGSGEAFAGGWNKVKLYFMLGLPTEEEEDIKGIAYLAEKIAENYYEIPKDQRNGKLNKKCLKMHLLFRFPEK